MLAVPLSRSRSSRRRPRSSPSRRVRPGTDRMVRPGPGREQKGGFGAHAAGVAWAANTREWVAMLLSPGNDVAGVSGASMRTPFVRCSSLLLKNRVLLIAACWRINLMLGYYTPPFEASLSAADRIIDHLGPCSRFTPLVL